VAKYRHADHQNSTEIRKKKLRVFSLNIKIQITETTGCRT